MPAAAPGLRQGGKFLKSVSINQNFLFSPVPVQCSVPVLVNYFQPVLYTSCQLHRGGGKTLSVDKMSVKGDWNEDTAAPALAQHWPVIVDMRHQNAITLRGGAGTKRWVWPGRCHRPEDQPIIITPATRQPLPCLPCQQSSGTLRNFVTHTIK